MPPSSDRAPFFHNRSAADLPTVVNFYNERFAIGPSRAAVAGADVSHAGHLSVRAPPDLSRLRSRFLVYADGATTGRATSLARVRGGYRAGSTPTPQLLPALGGPRLGARGAAFGP
jgi:hypothetical protein